MNTCARLLVLCAAAVGGFLPGVSRAAVNDSRLVNLSSRGVVGTDENILIAGFVIGGTTPKDVLIRALGPALTKLGVSGALAQVRLEVFDSMNQPIVSNQQWAATLKDSFTKVGASPLADNSYDAALKLSLAPGSYSAEITGLNGAQGVALVEMYEMDGTSRLLNLSTRARVESGDGLLISGLVVSGAGARRVLVRAAGPALAPQGITAFLADPVLTLLNSSGVALVSNDDWGEGGNASGISAVASAAGGFSFPIGSKDSALLADLAPGIYTIQVKGANATTGIALLEVYDVTSLPEAALLSVTSASAGASTYGAAAVSWNSADVDVRLGPTFAQLNPGAIDDRPTLFRPASKPAAGYFVRINPYEIGDAPGPDTNYWSDSGQVAYVPDNPTSDPGLDRVQTFAYYNQVFAISPRLDYASGTPHPDPQTRESYYATLNGGMPMQPVAMVRNYAMQQNEEIVVYRDGLFAVAGTQTSRSGSERPYPGFKFPPNKVPRAVAVTTSNEFALVAIWDTDRRQGQLAVVALEGKYLPFHTWPYMAMPNQGSFSDFKLLGYVDLPMASPNSVAAASNGLWTGPSSTDNKVLSQINLADDGVRQLVYNGDWQGVVAKNGYAIVSSTDDNKVAIVDLTPLFSYVRESYLSSEDSFQQTLNARGSGPTQFPQTFEANPGIAPKVIWQASITKPTATLAGQKIDRWSQDRFKAYVAAQDGTVHIIDASPLMARNSWETRGTLNEIGTVKVGRNPVNLCFTRFGESGLPLIPNDPTGTPRAPDPLNNMFYAACRGSRSIDAVVTWNGAGQVYRSIRDSRLGDPVAVGVASRGNIVTVADFRGKKLVSFRIGTIHDDRNNKVYPPGDPSYDYEFAGELPLSGCPFMVNSTNVN